MTTGTEHIADKVRAGERIAAGEALRLAEEAPLWLLSELATGIRRRLNGENLYYNRNVHIEPTNLCVFNCRFCSYRRPKGSPEAWDYTMEEIEELARRQQGRGITEVHIVGGVHPDHDLDYYCEMIRRVRTMLPGVAVKAFTAIELSYMIRKAGLSVREGLQRLIDAGMQAIPGGGAEIFDEELRARICPDKGSTAEWFEVHRAAHELGLHTNATILYGHVETWRHRIDHLDRLRTLQDETHGFDAFIPLKYRNYGNSMSEIGEVPVIEDSEDAGAEPHLPRQRAAPEGLLGDVRQDDRRAGPPVRRRRRGWHDRRLHQNLLHGRGRRPASRHDDRRGGAHGPCGRTAARGARYLLS